MNQKADGAEAWLQRLRRSKVNCWREGGSRRLRAELPGGEQLAEEWLIATSCLVRRAWRPASLGPLGAEANWVVELGEPPPDETQAPVELRESSDQPVFIRRNTRNNLEWRIRNLPYPIEVYSVAADQTDNCLIVKTTNKKYYKKLKIPEMERIGLPLAQANVSFIHKLNTLIISYKKPQELTEFEKQWYEELGKLEKPDNPVDDCKTS